MNQNITVIYTLEDMLSAFRKAIEGPGPLILSSPEGGAAFAGAGYYQAMFHYVKSLYPEVQVKFILDCANYPGWVMSALRQGVRCIRFSGNPEIAEKLRFLAQTYGAEIIMDL